MKKVRITNDCINIDKEKNLYKVWLGDYTDLGALKYHYFPSQKKSENFIKKTNKFLTDILHELNMVYARVGFEYRSNWAVFNYTSESFKLERKISDGLRTVEDNFNKIFSMCRVNHRNVGTHILRLLGGSCEFLCEVINILIDQNKKSSTTSNVYNYKFILNEIIRIKDRLNNYSDSSQLYALSMPDKPKEKLSQLAIKHNKNVRHNNKRRAKLQLRDRLKPKNNNNSSQREANSLLSTESLVGAKQP